MIARTVRQTVRDRGLMSNGDHVLVACSGGPDSMVLLHVLYHLRIELRITLCVASIDHSLRQQSAAEVELVGAFANSLGLPFRCARIHIPPQPGSIQASARKLRYQALLEIAAAQGASRVAVGHTMDDQAETVLARILRGSGLRGLCGIKAKRTDGLVRPLIDCRRQAVMAYACDRGLPFVEDPSNRQPVFERVRIRHQVMPVLLAEDPRLVEHLGALSDEARELDVYLEAQLPPMPSQGEREVCTEVLARLDAPLRTRWLRRWVTRETGVTPSRQHLVGVAQLLEKNGEVLLGLGWMARLRGGRLSLEYREHRRARSNRS